MFPFMLISLRMPLRELCHLEKMFNVLGFQDRQAVCGPEWCATLSPRPGQAPGRWRACAGSHLVRPAPHTQGEGSCGLLLRAGQHSSRRTQPGSVRPSVHLLGIRREHGALVPGPLSPPLSRCIFLDTVVPHTAFQDCSVPGLLVHGPAARVVFFSLKLSPGFSLKVESVEEVTGVTGYSSS